jgi:hypothetical protein
MKRPNNGSEVSELRRTYWERPGNRQTRNSQRRSKSKCQTSLPDRKRRKIVSKCPTLPTELWFLILRAMQPRDLHPIMRVNRLWYAEANKILCNKITTLLHGKGLWARFNLSEPRGDCFRFLDLHFLPSTFEAQKHVLFAASGGKAVNLSVRSILEKEGFDGLPEAVWRNPIGVDGNWRGAFSRGCLTTNKHTASDELYCVGLSKLCPGCNENFVGRRSGNEIRSRGGRLVHITDEGVISYFDEKGVLRSTTNISDV